MSKLDKIPDFTYFKNFEEAAQETLRFLHKKYGFGLWMVTRTVENDWIVLKSEDNFYNVSDGDVFKWSDSFCYHMVRSEGPNIAPVSKQVKAYANAPIGNQVPIQAYVGYPLVNPDGSLFGTLCAIDPKPQPEEIKADEDLLKILSQLLSLTIHHEQKSFELNQEIDNLKDKAYRDKLTGTLNRRAWDSLMEQQEKKCKLLGEPAGIILIDLDGLKALNDSVGHHAGDEYLKKAATAIIDAARKNDAVARLGGDEFGILVEASIALDPSPLINRIRNNLNKVGVSASLGWAYRRPEHNLDKTLKIADQNMYKEKTEKKANRIA
jgi:diguanylate cyclase (GGDEF)-like protein